MGDRAGAPLADRIQFALDSGEVFTASELKSNFYIINSSRLTLLVTDPLLDGSLNHLVLGYEDLVLMDEDLTRPAPDGDGTPADPEGAADPTAITDPEGAPNPDAPAEPGVRRRLVIPLLRGRNLVSLAAGPGQPPLITFPIFYKTPLRDWLESILKALIVLITIQFFVVQTFFIPTGSMQNTLMIGDYIMVEKVSYLFETPQRGDIVVFQYPNNPKQDFIKRMVARSGDRVQVKGKTLYVNGVPLKEPYTRYDEKQEGKYWSMFQNEQMPERVVSGDSLFVMGDNRDHSHDSRRWGDLPLYRVKGKAWLVYWPLKNFELLMHHGAVFLEAARRSLVGPPAEAPPAP